VKFRASLIAVIAAVAPAVVAPATASAASPAFTLGASSLSAGGDPSLTSAMTFGSTSPQSVTLHLAPGLLFQAAAGSSCLATAQTTSTTLGTGCNVANGMLLGPLTPVSFSVYIVPPPSSADIAGVALMTTGAGTATGAITLRTTSTVGLDVSVNLSTLSSVDASLTGMNLNVSGPLNGHPFTRLPTSCVADTSSLTVQYAILSENTTNQSPFTPTGCPSLAFSPKLAATATKDSADDFVQVTADVTPAAGQAAEKTLTLGIPSDLSPSLTNALALDNSGKSVGSATATSPLIPGTLSGNITLTSPLNNPLAASLTVTFASPFPVVLQGAVNVSNSSVTFSDVPDVPLTDLKLTLNGGSSGLFATTCSPSTGTLSGSFTGQNGVTARSNAALTVKGCPTTSTGGRPAASRASLRGLVRNKAKLAFTVNEGTNAKPIKTIKIGLPRGISFSNSKTTLKQGILVKRGGRFNYKLSHGVLTITLSSAASKPAVTLESPAISVSPQLAKNVKAQLKKKKVSALDFKLRFTDSGGTASTFPLKLKPKS
jgi:hypothetical protein